MPKNKKANRHRMAAVVLSLSLCLMTAAAIIFPMRTEVFIPAFSGLQPKTAQEEDFIKWVDFNASYPALQKALALDINTYEREVHIKWTDILAYLSCQYGNNFKLYQPRDIDKLAEKLTSGQTMEGLTKSMKSFAYYQEAYEAVLGGFLGLYQTQAAGSEEESAQSRAVLSQRYGLKVFSPIAGGFWYEDYDDFGVNRSYGYHRRHLGHDLLISIGAPVVAIESGIVENMGWNQYGGWRIGIRSFDGKRYYYYAHLRKDRPYAAGLYQGKSVSAGEVIGYTGRTGYSSKENVNNIKTPHLHIGMQLIFDESQREGAKEIWIDLYELCRLLAQNKSEVVKDEQTKEYTRRYPFSESNYFLRGSKLYVPAASSAAAPGGSIPVPIIMYHSLLKHSSVKNDFIISPQLLESDLRYLKERGYQAITMAELIAYVKRGVPLPQKPVILTFDDGHYNNYYYAFPLLKEYNMKAVVSIVGILTDEASRLADDNPAYSYLTWEQVKELAASGYVEIQNHSMDLHHYRNNRHGAAKRSGEELAAYTSVLDADVNLMQHKIARVTGTLPNTFTYPFGQLSRESDQIMRDFGFQATLGCRNGMNYILPDAKAPQQLFNLRRNLRAPNISSQEYFRYICP